MQSTDSRSPALNRPEPARQRLTSPWTLLGIAIAVAITLILIFPGRGILTTQTVSQAGPDAVSLTYLANLARQEPNNPSIRFKLAEEQVKLGRIAEARAALEPLYNSPDPAVRQSARLQDFKLQMQQMYAMAPGSKERAKESERLRQELVAMTQYQWDTAGLNELADIAAQIGARKVRAELYMRIVKSDPGVTREWIDEAAQKVLADGEYLATAELHFAAMARAKSLEDRRHHFTSAIRAYQAGDMAREALLAAEAHMGPLANDDATLLFMIKLARAVNDLKRAQVYAKRLLRLSHERTLMRWARAIAGLAIPSARAAEVAPGTVPSAPSVLPAPGAVPPPAKPDAPRPEVPKGMRPYDPQNYQLAYEIFLANKNLDDAYRVARAAVDQVPNDVRWRERLAQVAEWSGRPGESLEHWLFIARRTGQGSAWQAVMRVAPGLFEDEALLEALRYQAGTGASLTDDQWRAIVDAYERVGRPREGIEFLEREMQRRPRPVLLESIAYLKERSGDVDGAIAAYRRLMTQSGPTTERVTTLATLLIARGRFKEAYDLLEGYRPKAPSEDAEYLRLLAELADRLQDDTAAQVAYERLVAHPRAEAGDFSRLIELMQVRQPEAAARLAEAAYGRFKDPSFLIAALGIHSSRRDFTAMRRILTGLPPDLERQLETRADFLLLRAEYRGATGRPRLALADFREALRIDPNNRFARLGLMFLLIDVREFDLLRREMPIAVKLAQAGDPDFQGAVGSAYLAMSDPKRALPYYAARVKRTPDDYVWLLNYADALDQSNQPDAAFRVRRHAWIKIREEVAKQPQGKVPLQLLQAQARVALQFMPIDQSSAVIRNLLRADAEQSTTPSVFDPEQRGIDAATRDLVLAWTIQTNDYAAAKAWLLKQWGRTLAQPTWAETRVAIEHNDVETQAAALERRSAEAIPRYDRHQAARNTQQYRYAQTIAFTELEKQPYDDEMHLRLTQSVFDMVNHTQVGYTNFRRGTIAGHEYTSEVAVWLGPRLRLSADVSYIDQRLLNTSALATIPGADRQFGITALWRHSVGETTFSIFHREALAEGMGLRFTHSYPLGPRIGTRIGLAYNERALETSALAAGGVRDQVFLDVSYQLAKREYLFGQLYASRFYTQGDRTYIGSAQGLNWEAGHRFRTEYPDFHVRLAGSINHYNLSGSGDVRTAALNPDGTVPTAAFFLPGSFSVYGIYTGFGTFYQTNYTRAVRPFVDLGINRNTVTGTGYSALAGMSGSVFGSDRLTAYISTGRGGTGQNELSREIGLRYMYLFDHF